MNRLLWHCRNWGRVTYLELLWGLRIPESVIYNVLGPALVLILLGLIRGSREYLQILVPGLISLTVASSAMRGVGTTMSFMRAYGSWRTLQASPIPTPLYFAGLVASRVVRILVIVALMLLIAAIVLGAVVRGSLALIFVYTVFGCLVFAAFGLVIASLTRSPQAVSGAMNLVLLPMIFTSDVLFVSRVPWVEKVSLLFPLTYLVDLMRDTFLGLGERDVLPDLLALAIWLAACSWLALVLARRRVEEV